MAFLILGGGGYASYCGLLILSGNFHVVVDGQLYRSAELSHDKFEGEIKAHGIKSILNLRGPNVGSPWYDGEVAAAKEEGIAHYDIGISARRVVTLEKTDEILAVLRDAPKPLLIHCSSGADRSGFVSALFLYAVQDEPAETASKALSLRYGHFPYLTSQSGAMDESFKNFTDSHPH